MLQDDAMTAGSPAVAVMLLLPTPAASGRKINQPRICRVRNGRRRVVAPSTPPYGDTQPEGNPPWPLAWLGSFTWENWAAIRRF